MKRFVITALFAAVLAAGVPQLAASAPAGNLIALRTAANTVLDVQDIQYYRRGYYWGHRHYYGPRYYRPYSYYYGPRYYRRHSYYYGPRYYRPYSYYRHRHYYYY
jgi:hypothetical protein